jgi:curli biogenesis system outer membrane secretion channel CsgG
MGGCAGTKQGQGAKATPGDVSAYPPYQGLKKRLAVLGLENKVKTEIPNPSWKIGDGLTEMLMTELFKTDRFIMVERAALAEIVKEQELGQTGLVGKDTATRVGHLLGAQLLVAGAVTEFEAASKGGGGGFGYAGFAFALKSSSAHVAVDIRLVDAATGQILKSFNAEGRAEETALAFAGTTQGVTFGSDAFVKTPIGQATREAMYKAVMFIVEQMETVPWTARVVKVEHGKVYANAGANMNLKPGVTLAAYSMGEALIDPVSGLSLGSMESRAGTVTLMQVEEKFSIGTFAGAEKLKRGDMLRLEQVPSARGAKDAK